MANFLIDCVRTTYYSTTILSLYRSGFRTKWQCKQIQWTVERHHLFSFAYGIWFLLHSVWNTPTTTNWTKVKLFQCFYCTCRRIFMASKPMLWLKMPKTKKIFQFDDINCAAIDTKKHTARSCVKLHISMTVTTFFVFFCMNLKYERTTLAKKAQRNLLNCCVCAVAIIYVLLCVGVVYVSQEMRKVVKHSSFPLSSKHMFCCGLKAELFRWHKTVHWSIHGETKIKTLENISHKTPAV